MDHKKEQESDLTQFKAGQWSSSSTSKDEKTDKPPSASPALMDEGMRVRTPLGQPPRRRKKRRVSGVKNLYAPKKKSSNYGFWKSIYRFLYYIGIQVMRMELRLRRRVRYFYIGARKKLSHRRQTALYRRQKRRTNLVRSFFAPFRDLHRHWTFFKNNVKEARQLGRWNAIRAVFSSLRYLLRNIWRDIIVVFNYIAPAAALLLLIVTISNYSTMSLALSVNYAGEQVGYIHDEGVFSDAERAVKERIINEEYLSPENPVPTFTLAVMEEESLTDVDTLTDRLIIASGNTLEEADGLYIDGHFIGATSAGDDLLDFLNSELEQHSTDTEEESISFIKKIELREGIYPVSSVVELPSLIQTISSDVQEERVYVVQAGDTPTGIASKNDVPYSSIKALNPDIEDYSFFHPGAEVLVSKAVPYLGVQVTRTEIYEVDVAFGYEDTSDNTLPEGYVSTSRSGVAGTDELVAHVTYIDNVEVSRNVISTTRIKEPVDAKRLVGTKKPLSSIGGGTSNASGFMWPVASGVFNGSLGSYWGHTGMDISQNFLAGVYASKGGIVVYSTYYGPYGNHIIVDHGDGVQTLYAHLNDRYVGVGTTVNQGDLIGRVGRTGNVTGPHLHFEIRINGRYMDPVNYIGTYRR